ncbi:5684_t:CDS:1, partial [Gigaspora margarita]
MSFFKKFINKLKKRNTLTSEETFVNTWKEESKFKKFFKNLFKRDEKEEVIEENFWSWNKKDDYSPYLASIDKDSFKTLLIQTENEKQSGFDCLETSDYL